MGVGWSDPSETNRRLVRCDQCGGYWPASDDDSLGELEEIVPEHVCIYDTGQTYLRPSEKITRPH